MKKYDESIYKNNILKKYNKALLSKSYSKNKYRNNNYDNKLLISEIKKYSIPKKKFEGKKLLKLRNFSSKYKKELLCLKNPNKSNFVQNILNELIPKNIRKPYGIKNKNIFPNIHSKTENKDGNKINKINNGNKYVKKRKIIFKKVSFIQPKNVTNKYIKKIKKEKSDNNMNIGYFNKKEKFINNFLTPYNEFISRDFKLTNNEYGKLINKINDLNIMLNSNI